MECGGPQPSGLIDRGQLSLKGIFGEKKMNKFKLFGLAVAVTFSANAFVSDDAQASYVVFADGFEPVK